nr:antigen 5 like allergen Cul n 1-like [Bactrocera oleae]XP_036213986.1 antigen 5 like allergen Cul n 1-like [Bactrocera oleae]
MFRLCFIVLGIIALASAVNLFCTLKCLKFGAQHGACMNPNGRLNGDCPPTTRILNMNMHGYKKFLLNKHNQLRNTIAGGGIGNLPKANKMGEVFWDRQLGFLSVFSSKRCRLSDPYCYRTSLLPNPGRVAKTFQFNNKSEVNPTNVKLKIGEWFKEINEMANTFKDIFPPHAEKVLNVAHIIEAANNRLGCSMSQWKSKDATETLILVCLYASDLKNNLPLYSVGPTASKCLSKRSILYRNLCSINEDYDYAEGLPQFIKSNAKVPLYSR